MSSPNYRAPAGKATEKSAPRVDDIELDGAAFSKRLQKLSKLDEHALEERIARTARQLRLRAGLSFALGAAMLALSAPQLIDHFRSRATGNALILGSALAMYGVFIAVAGDPRAESLKDVPAWHATGQVGSACIGGAIGLLLAIYL